MNLFTVVSPDLIPHIRKVFRTNVCFVLLFQAFPALNLVRGALKPSDERKQWLCSSPDEKFATVTLTYEKPFVISSLEIKNNGSAYVQVEGGCSEDPGRFKVQ